MILSIFAERVVISLPYFHSDEYGTMRDDDDDDDGGGSGGGGGGKGTNEREKQKYKEMIHSFISIQP